MRNIVWITLLAGLTGCSQPAAQPTPTPADSQTPTPAAVQPAPAAVAQVSLVDGDSGLKFEPTSKTGKLYLYAQAGGKPATLVLVGIDTQNRVASNPQVHQLTDEALKLDYPRPAGKVRLYAAVLEDPSPEATAVAELVKRCQQSSAPNSPAARALCSQLNEWYGEQSFGTAHVGQVVPELGGTRSSAAQEAAGGPGATNSLDGKGGNKPQAAPATGRIVAAPDWHATADRTPYGSGVHGVVVYSL